MILHAGLVAARVDGHWRGALIEGPSGAGKSDLALRALDHGFRLVADDRVRVWTSGGRLYGRAPDVLAELIEMRGLGIGREAALPFCRVALAVRCGQAERFPDPELADYLGLSVPILRLAALEPSAPAKLRRAMQHLGAGEEGAYLDASAVGASPRTDGDTR